MGEFRVSLPHLLGLQLSLYFPLRQLQSFLFPDSEWCLATDLLIPAGVAARLPARPFRSKKCLRRTRSPIFQQCFATRGYFPAMDTTGTVPASCCRFVEFASQFSPRTVLRSTRPTSEYPPSVCGEGAPQSGKRSTGKTSRFELPLLKYSQQRDLGLCGKLADLV